MATSCALTQDMEPDQNNNKNIIVQGYVQRESTVFAGIVNLRYFVLLGNSNETPSPPSSTSGVPTLCSYRSRNDTLPSKTWKLLSGTAVTELTTKSFSIRQEGQSFVGMVTSMAVGKGPQKTMLVSGMKHMSDWISVSVWWSTCLLFL